MKKKLLPLFFSAVLIGSVIFRENVEARESFEQQARAFIENKEKLDNTKLLHQIFDLYIKWKIASYPEFATFNGYPGQNHRWTDLSPGAVTRREEQIVLFSNILERIERSYLSEADQLNYDLFKTNISFAREGSRFQEEYMPINKLYGVQTEIPEVLKAMPASSIEDYEDILARYRGIPRLIDQIILLLKKGLEEGITAPKVVMHEVPQQILNIIADDPLESRMLSAFKHFPHNIPAADQERLREEAIQIFTKEVFPAFRVFHDYLVKIYIPQARETIGLSALPDGKAWYAFYIYQYTTMRLTPEEVHKIGLEEVSRIRQDMENIIEKTGFQGSFSDFTRFLNGDSQFFFENAGDLLVAYRNIAKRADPGLVKLFGKIPRLPYGIKPVPAYKEKSQPAAYYEPGSHNAHRPGYFFVNTYNLRTRPKWEMEALTLHEAVPGHHLQISLEREMECVPEFRKYSSYAVFAEGWGLYAESLGEEMGFYQNPYSKFGQLMYEMWRAVRLVVDTGIHALGWSRNQAIDFFKNHTAKAEHDIIVEVDRYIAIPGQAVSYKIGELKIRELRSYCKKELGDMFDIRAFHDALLRDGSLPLCILETNMKEWVSAQKQRKK